MTATKKCSPLQIIKTETPEVRVTSGQKSSTKIIYIVLQTSVWVFAKYSFIGIKM